MLNNAQGPQNYMVNQSQNPAGMYFYCKKYLLTLQWMCIHLNDTFLKWIVDFI